MFHVTLTMNDQGECKLHANEQEREYNIGRYGEWLLKI